MHVFISISLIIVVLMQSAKGEGLAGAFGGGGISGAVFGGRGAATFLSKTTTILAVAFMVSCIMLTFTGGGTGVTSSRIATEAERTMQDAPVTPLDIPAEGQPAGQPMENVSPQGGTQQPAGQQGGQTQEPQGGQ